MWPGEVSRAGSGFIVGIVSDVLSFMKLEVNDDTLSLVVRKLAHLAEFFLLGLALSTYLIQEEIETYHIFSIGFIVAIIDEFIQLFVDGRNGNVIDIGIDMLGMLLAFIFVKFYNKMTHHRT